jgi:hypothetical protein
VSFSLLAVFSIYLSHIRLLQQTKGYLIPRSPLSHHEHHLIMPVGWILRCQQKKARRHKLRTPTAPDTDIPDSPSPFPARFKYRSNRTDHHSEPKLRFPIPQLSLVEFPFHNCSRPRATVDLHPRNPTEPTTCLSTPHVHAPRISMRSSC